MAFLRPDVSTGKRLYIETAFGEPVIDRLKSLGCHWEPSKKLWWVSPRKRTEVERLLVESDHKVESGAEPAQRLQDPHDIKVHAKVTYKGRTYYQAASTKDGSRLRLVSLPNAQGIFLDFWAPAAECEVTRRYQPREVWDGRRYSNRTVKQYTTLGSIADFIAEQKEPGERCAECGKKGDLVADLEDGCLKHRWCCDLAPS